MKILTGSALDPNRFFKPGSAPKIQGSSFDLTIGHVYDTSGNEINGPFVLKRGSMVQVVSAEVFNLPDNVTGHVTYKTSLTQEGIWALTVGIVDPGWDGPIATTLLNFSRVDHTIHKGDVFLRVSLFEHDAVPINLVRKSKPLPEYLKKVQSLASSRFSATFLDSEKIAEDAGKHVMSRIRVEGLGWLTVIAIVFTVIQIFAPPVSKMADNWLNPNANNLQTELETLKSKVIELEAIQQKQDINQARNKEKVKKP